MNVRGGIGPWGQGLVDSSLPLPTPFHPSLSGLSQLWGVLLPSPAAWLLVEMLLK